MSALSPSARRDAGLTLVELLIAMVLTSILGGVILTVVLGVHTGTVTTEAQQNLNEEARLALNRIARELRQANAITAVQNPDGSGVYNPNAITSVTFTADFNGDGCINAPGNPNNCTLYNATDPEQLTYCWDPTASVRELFLIPGALGNGATCESPGSQAILSGDVSAFKLSYRSTNYLCDANNDGITTWQELDACGPPYGNQNNTLDTELSEIDSIVVEVTASNNGSHTQTYTTEVDLRNLS
jgi:type II secretory pathway pseudopilin PulG